MDGEAPIAALNGLAEPETPARLEGRLLHGIMRARGDNAGSKLAADTDELVRHRGLAALVHRVPYSLPDWEPAPIREHSQAIERAMRRATIVPAPYGIVFRDVEHVKAFLEEQQIALDEALAFLDGAFEMRLHIYPSGRRPGRSEREQSDRAAQFYTALRRRARAALPLATPEDGILSAAFLVDRSDWVGFVEHTDELDADHPEFRLDLTGPWPPYDFVRIAFIPRERPGL